MLVKPLSPLLSASFAAAFVLPESLRANKLEQYFPEPLKEVAHAVKCAESVLDAFAHPGSEFGSEDKTVYGLINSHPDFTRLAKVVNFAGDNVINVLNDTDASFTFFAPDNKALTPPKHHGDDYSLSLMTGNSELDLSQIVHSVEQLRDDDDDDDDDDKKRRREALRKLASAVLLYHTVPETAFSADQLAVNTTFATGLTLHDESLDEQPLRLRVAPAHGPHRSLVVNFYATVVRPDVNTVNGAVHVINHALLPPPSIFQELFQFSNIFSVHTSALQRTDLDPFVEWRYVPSENEDEEGSIQGNPAVTHFAPTNAAWAKLPKRLALYLFSPFGERALKKVLAYHIVPNYVLHTDYGYNVTTGEEVFIPAPSDDEDDGAWINALYPAADSAAPGIPRPPKYYSFAIHPGTLLGQSHPVHVEVTKRVARSPLPGPNRPKTYFTHFEVNGERVFVGDTPARNGAVHAIDKVLDPRGKKHGRHVSEVAEHHNWEDWEEWLPAWAEEAWEL